MSSLVKRHLNGYFNKFYFSQQTEGALRYSPIVSILKNKKSKSFKMLEINPGGFGIKPYLNIEIDGFDITRNGAKNKLKKDIKSTSSILPFKKNSYDITINADTLSSLGMVEREKLIFEILRITKKLIIITVPSGVSAQNQDNEFSIIWKNIFKRPNQTLEDHLNKGLPTVDEMLMYIDKSKRALGKTAQVNSYPSLNLFVRKIITRIGITNNKYLYFLCKRGFLLLVPILKYCNFGNTYRRVFVIEFRE